MAPSIATKPLEHLLKRLIIRIGLTMARSRQGKDDVSDLASIFDCLVRRNDLREWESMRDRESRVANCRPLSYSFDCSPLGGLAHRVDEHVSNVDVSCRERRKRVRRYPSHFLGVYENVAALFCVPLHCTAFDCDGEVARTL